MSAYFPPLQIRIYGHDGSNRSFTQSDPQLANQALTKLDPAKLFAADNVTILDDAGEFTFAVSHLVRIDIVTDRLSVWDFPFVLGAHVELTEDEFRGYLDTPQPWDLPQPLGDLPVFVHITLKYGQRYYFWMEVAGGLSAVRRSRIRSLTQQRQLIFGLRTGGIGVLNLAQMERISFYPELPGATAEAESLGYKVERNEFGLPAFQFASSQLGD